MACACSSTRTTPGAQTHQHAHSAFVLYEVADFSRTIPLPDGKQLQRQFRRGDALWSDRQTHVGTNSGQTPTHALLVEMKSGIAACASR